MQPFNKDVAQENECVGYGQAAEVDAGRHLAHARRAEHPQRDGVTDDADEDDERRDVGVEILAVVEEFQVGLHGSVTTGRHRGVTRCEFSVARFIGSRRRRVAA